MTYNNTFDSSKNYENVRFQFGQKPVSQEFNSVQSMQHRELELAFDTLFDNGFIYLGLNLITGTPDTLTLSSGYVQINGRSRLFPSTSFNISSSGNLVTIWARLVYNEVTSTEDTDLQHPLQPDLPVGTRANATTSLTIVDPAGLSTPSDFIEQFYVQILSYNKQTGVLTKLVNNLNKFMTLQNIPGQIQPGQIGPGSIDTESIDIKVDGMSLIDKFALTVDDQSGSFLAAGGAVVYDSNTVDGVKIRLEAFRAYVQGYLVRFYRDMPFVLDHTSDTKTRSNESKTFGVFKTFVDADVNTTTDIITITGHGFTTGNSVQLSTSGVLPTATPALTALTTTYYLNCPDADTFSLHTTLADATGGTNLIDITSAAGGGTHRIGTHVYSITKTPVNTISAADGDVHVGNATAETGGQSVTRGAGDYDTLTNIPVVSIQKIKQSSTTYTQGVDYQVSGDQVQWISGTRPTQGTSYTVYYTYRAAFAIGSELTLDTSKKTLTFSGAKVPVSGTSFQITYTHFVPRVDILGVLKNGSVQIYKGTPNEQLTPPVVPTEVFQLASISLPAGSQLGDTFLDTWGYTKPSSSSIDFRTVQIIASKMRDHQRRYQNLQDIAFNSSLDSVATYLITKDPTLAKLGSFADGFYDDRLSDYGQPTQNIVFNSDLKQGEGSRSSITKIQEHDGTIPSSAKVHSASNILSLNYTEVEELAQTKWSDSIDLQPFAVTPVTRTINVPNRDLIAGQTITIEGHNWDYGENQIQFFINDTLLTGITIVTGTSGVASNSVNANGSGTFKVTFTVPGGIPTGYRIVKAISAVTLNQAEFLVGYQTASTPLPSIGDAGSNAFPQPTADAPCGQKKVVSHAFRFWKSRSVAVYTVRYDCTINNWVICATNDPIAQTFIPEQNMFITGVDVWFTGKDSTASVYVSLLETTDGVPNLENGELARTLVPNASVLVDGNATHVVFSSPVYVKAGSQYAIYLEAPVTGFKVQYAKAGGFDRTSYTSGAGGYHVYSSASTNPIGPYIGVADANKRDRDTTYRWTEKTMTFTPTTAVTVLQIDTPVYIGADSAKYIDVSGRHIVYPWIYTAAAHGLSDGNVVYFVNNTPGGRIAFGLNPNTKYYVKTVDATTITVHPTLADAQGNTNPVDLFEGEPLGNGVTQVVVLKEAIATWELKDTTTNTVIWTGSRRLLMNITDASTITNGKWVAKGYESLFTGNSGSSFDPITLVANHAYQLKISADQAAAYPWLRDNYQSDGKINGSITTFLGPNLTTMTTVSGDVLTSGTLYASPDKIGWFADKAADLRFKLYRADFSANPTTQIVFKGLNTSPGAGEISIADSFTHFTALVSALTPSNTNLSFDYSLDGGTTWLAHTPVVFKRQVFNDDVDREFWAYFNFGYYSQTRFAAQQINPQAIPVNPNKSTSAGVLTTAIKFRLNLSTTDSHMSPIVDMSNWAARLDKLGLTTTYFSRTVVDSTDAATSGTPAKVYVWAVLPSGVTQDVYLTLGGDLGSPTYVQKSSPSSTRVIDSAKGIVEYQYDYAFGDLSGFGTGLRKNPKVKVVWTTNNRFIQPQVFRIGYNIF